MGDCVALCHFRSIFGEISLDEMKFPAFGKTFSIFMLLFVSLLLEKCPPDICKKSHRIRIRFPQLLQMKTKGRKSMVKWE